MSVRHTTPSEKVAAPRLSGTSRAEPVEQAIFWLFLAGLAWTPFWYGSNDLVAWGVNAALFPGLAAVYEASILLRGERHPVAVRNFAASAALFIGVVLWVFIQSATWAPSRFAHPIWDIASEALGTPLAGSISVNRDLTTLALVRLIAAASVFWIAVQLCRDAFRAMLLIRAIAAICTFYVVYAFVISALRNGRLPSFGAPSTATIASTFINRNSFAIYAGIGLIAMCGLVLRLYRREVGNLKGAHELQLASFIETTGQKGAALLAGGALLLISILLTGSRGGLVATGAALLAFFVLSAGGKQGRTGQIQVVVFAIIAIGAAFFAFGDMIAGKIASIGFADASRMAVYSITVLSILDRPLSGHGYGAFVDVFPMYRDRSIPVQGIWEQAHNTYLELFQGLGLVFGAMLVMSVSLLVLACVRGAMTRKKHEMIPRIAASVGVLVAVQALVDFGLQIQAVAITFMAVLGAGVAQSQSSRLSLGDRCKGDGEASQPCMTIQQAGETRTEAEIRNGPTADHEERSHTRFSTRLRAETLLTLLVVMGLSGFAVLRGIDIVRFTNMKSRPMAERAAELPPWASVPGIAFSALEASSRQPINPLNPDDARKRRDQFAAMLGNRPLDSMTWLSLAGMRHATGQPSSDLLSALLLSFVTGPNEGYIMSQRGVFGLMQWEGLSSEGKRRAVGDFATAYREHVLTDRQRTTAASILAVKDPDARNEIAELLRSEGLSPTDLGRIGL